MNLLGPDPQWMQERYHIFLSLSWLLLLSCPRYPELRPFLRRRHIGSGLRMYGNNMEYKSLILES